MSISTEQLMNLVLRIYLIFILVFMALTFLCAPVAIIKDLRPKFLAKEAKMRESRRE